MKTILVIDDEKPMVDLFRLMFQSADEEIAIAAAYNGEQALTYLQDSVPDVIVLDLWMPDINGDEILTHIKSDERLVRVPVLVITARTTASSAEREQWIARGATDFVKKPFTPKDVVDQINEMLAV